jgi:hypothetical protein
LFYNGKSFVKEVCISKNNKHLSWIENWKENKVCSNFTLFLDGGVMKGYELVENRYDNGVKFYFISSGKRNVMKLVDFENVSSKEYDSILIYKKL